MGRRRAHRKKEHPHLHWDEPVTRRDLLVGLAATFASAVVPASSLTFQQHATSAKVLSNAERETLGAVVSRIIPADDNGPGALESGCARYIESSLAGAYRSLTDSYISGLGALHSAAKSRGAESFAALPVSEQDRILTDFERNTPVGDYRGGAAFFELVRTHTLEGMFGDPSYGGNVNFAGWDLIRYPGPRMYVSSEMQNLDAKISPERVSAARLNHGAH